MESDQSPPAAGSNRIAPFISLEGNEGCGKSTQISRVAGALRAQGRDVLEVREPGGTEFGERVRDIFKNPPPGTELTGWAEVFLLSAARHQLVHDKILPALRQGTVVLADRFVDSTFVYQGSLRKLNLEALESVCRIATDKLVPDHTFYLSAPVDILNSRIAARPAKSSDPEDCEDRFDQSNIETKKQIESAFQSRANQYPDRFTVIDATQTPEIICNTITDYIVRNLLVGKYSAQAAVQ